MSDNSYVESGETFTPSTDTGFADALAARSWLKDQTFQQQIDSKNVAIGIFQRLRPDIARNDIVNNLPGLVESYTNQPYVDSVDPAQLVIGQFQKSMQLADAEVRFQEAERRVHSPAEATKAAEIARGSVGGDSMVMQGFAKSMDERAKKPFDPEEITKATEAVRKARAEYGKTAITHGGQWWQPFVSSMGDMAGQIGLTVPETLAGLAVAGPAGLTLGMFDANARMVAASSYSTMRDRGVEARIADPISMGIGAVTSAVGTIGLTGMAEVALKDVVGKVASEAGTLLSRTLSANAQKFGIVAGIGTLDNTLQAVPPIIGENLGYATQNKETQTKLDQFQAIQIADGQLRSQLLSGIDEYNKTAMIPLDNADEITKRMGDAFWTSATAMILIGSTGLGAGTLHSLRQMKAEDAAVAFKGIVEGVANEKKFELSKTATPEEQAAFSTDSTTGKPVEVQTGHIVTGDLQTPRAGEGIRVTVGETPAHGTATISPEVAIKAVQASHPQAVADLFAQAVETGKKVEGLPSELGTLARNIYDGATDGETMAVAQRYGIEPDYPKISQVQFKGKFATLTADEMKNSGPAIAEYKKAGFDGVQAGNEIYVFNLENIQKIGEVARPEVMHLDPANSDVKAGESAVKITSNGKTQELPITRDSGSVKVAGEVSQFTAERVAKELADKNMGQRIEADSPVLQRAIEELNPDHMAIRERIGALETAVENAKADNAPNLRELESELATDKDSLTVPTEAWKVPQPHQLPKADYEAVRAKTLTERAGLGNSIHEQLLKAAPNVTEAQAKTLSGLIDRLESRAGQKLVEAIRYDEGILDENGNIANGAANQAEKVIRLGKEANFDTVFHEVSHLARTLLTPEQHKTMIEELGLETKKDGVTLTRSGEEKFAEASRTYVQHKEGGSGILEQIKAFIRDIVRAIAPRLSDKAVKVFDELFGEGDTFSHDASGKVGGDGGLAGGTRTQSEPGMVPAGGAEAQPVLDNSGQPSDPTLANRPDTNGVSGEVLDRQRLAPNGKPSKLDANQYEQVRTPEFKAWFGDWEKGPVNASKVVDENGEPKVVYHGTSSHGFDSFDSYGSNYGLFGQGSYFTDSRNIAESYTSKGKGSSTGVYSTFVNLRNPIDMDAIGERATWEKAYPEYDFSGVKPGSKNEAYYREAEDFTTNEQLPKWEGAELMQDGLRRAGFDGIVHEGGGRVKGSTERHDVAIAFDPNQIKSATDNSGAFDAEDTSILFQKKGATEHERLIQQALTDGKWVPDRVLEDYIEKPWALEEWNRRHPAETRAMEKHALTTATAQEFVDGADFILGADIPEEIRALPQAEQDAALEAFWHKINDPVDGRAQGNAKWLAEIQTDDGLAKWVGSLIGHEAQLSNKGLPGRLFSAIASLKYGRDIDPVAAKALRTFAENYPDAMREAGLKATRDTEGLARFKQEAEWAATKNKIDEAAGEYNPEEMISAQKEALRQAGRTEKANQRTMAEQDARLRWQTKLETDSRLEVRKRAAELADELRAVAEGEPKAKRNPNGGTDVQLEAQKTLMDEKATPAEKSAARRAMAGMGTFQAELTRAEKAVRDGANDAVTQVKAIYEDALKSAKEEAKGGANVARLAQWDKIQGLTNALADAKKEHVQTLRHLADARAERKSMEKLASQIMRRVSSKTVDVSAHRFLKDIQNQLDPTFRKASTHTKRAETMGLLNQMLKDAEDGKVTYAPEFIADMKRSVEHLFDKTNKKSLDQFTHAELNDLAIEFNRAYEFGRDLMKAKEAAFRNEVDSAIMKIVSGMRPIKGEVGQELALNSEVFKGYEGSLADKIRTLTHDPQRIFDWLDGGKDFKGPLHEEFYKAVDEAVNAELRMEQKFMTEFETVLQDNGFKSMTGKNASVSALYKKVKVGEQEWQVQEIMDIYLKWQNDKSRAALIGDGERSGNRIDQALHDELVAQLTPEQKAVADWILDYYNRTDTKTTLAEFHEGFANTPFVDEPNYTPIERIGRFKERSETELKAELMGRSSSVMGTIDKSNTIERVNIAAHNQTPLKLGAIDTLISYQHHMSHYMSHAEPMKKLDAIYADKHFQQAVQERLGSVGVDSIGRFLDRVKNPNIDKNPAWYFNVFRQSAGNIAKAFMAYNPKTILRQIPAFLYFAGELDNPLMLARGIAEVNAGWGEAWDTMSRLSPQWKNRVQDPIMREIINGTNDNYVKLISDNGMKGIGFVDQVVAGWGWWAKFIEGREKYGLDETQAAHAADEAMNRTQQVSRTKDEAELYSKNEFLKWWTMFTGPLNKVWGQMTYDIWNRPNGARTAFTAMGLFTAGLTGWIVANGKAPTTEDDWKQVMLGEVMGAPVPIIGTSIVNWAYGYERTGRLSPWEFVSEAGDAVKVAQKLAAGDYTTAEGMAKIADKTYGAIALATGAPLVEVRRVFQVTADAANGKEVDLRDLIGKNYGR